MVGIPLSRPGDWSGGSSRNWTVNKWSWNCFGWLFLTGGCSWYCICSCCQHKTGSRGLKTRQTHQGEPTSNNRAAHQRLARCEFLESILWWAMRRQSHSILLPSRKTKVGKTCIFLVSRHWKQKGHRSHHLLQYTSQNFQITHHSCPCMYCTNWIPYFRPVNKLWYQC